MTLEDWIEQHGINLDWEAKAALKDVVNMKKDELNEIFEGSQNAVNEMKKVFGQHESIETVIVEPNSWVGKELLLQTKRLIDIRRDVNSLSASINRVEKMLVKLFNNTEK